MKKTKKSNTITALAFSRLRFQKSRTLLTGIAIMLTTMLLTAIGTVGLAAIDMNRQVYAQSDYHATFSPCTAEQIAVLSKHLDVETMTTREVFANLVNGKMNGVLTYQNAIKDDRADASENFGVWAPAEGHAPEAADEICSTPAFFRRMGAEPILGGKVSLSFRINGKGEILTREFTVSGLLADVEIDENMDDSRLMWSALVSPALLAAYEDAGLYVPEYDAVLRVYGEEDLFYDEIKDKIYTTAADIGLDQDHVILNDQYLYTATNPDTDAIMIIAAISLIVIVFSALVIYSIFYVGVITDVQEIGKLKALGASKKQIAGLFHRQGLLICAAAIPPGLLIGYLLPYFLFPLVIRAYSDSALNSTAQEAASSLNGQIHMFSLPYLCLVAVTVLITVWISLLKPIRMAKKVSPAEAIRYQENTVRTKTRKGHKQVKVSTLTFANLTRNRKRTIVTILTMGLSCVLFICVSAVLSSVSAEDIARRNIPRGDFRIVLDYSLHDREYPENNLENLVQQNYFSDAFLDELRAIDGVTAVEREHGKIVSSADTESLMYDDYENKLPLSYFTRDDVAELNRWLSQGTIDYDRMTANREVICTHAYSFEQYGLSLGDTFSVTLHDGGREIPFTYTLTALSEPDADFNFLLMTEDAWKELELTYDPTTSIYLEAEKDHYDSVKEALTQIVSEHEYFGLYALDVEMLIGKSSVSVTKYPLYLLLLLIAVIGFINLINTMITSIVTRKRELAILQAVGLSGRQLVQMLSGEGLVFTAGTLLISLTLGNLAGWLLFRWAEESHFMSISRYHYPLWESLGLVLVLIAGQLLITLFIRHKMAKESLTEQIKGAE
ncbi:MAG: ABC transporter permease [Bacteroidales bacterium]|nr:ABC transporter permease [Bacteroidales bacterium]MCM1416135.1 ABC transporter permease [bacterium]MCM1423050.1 ABC transporter permease [bacterium]